MCRNERHSSGGKAQSLFSLAREDISLSSQAQRVLARVEGSSGQKSVVRQHARGQQHVCLRLQSDEEWDTQGDGAART